MAYGWHYAEVLTSAQMLMHAICTRGQRDRQAGRQPDRQPASQTDRQTDKVAGIILRC